MPSLDLVHPALAITVDDDGVVARPDSTPGDTPAAAQMLCDAYGTLVAADLTLLGARVVETGTVHVALCSMLERSREPVTIWTGTGTHPDPITAVARALHDAVLTPWAGSALRAGATRLVLEGTCLAARVTDRGGDASLGRSSPFPPLGPFAESAESGSRLAMGTEAGEFRAFALGRARVALAVGSAPSAAARVESWFDALDRACG